MFAGGLVHIVIGLARSDPGQTLGRLATVAMAVLLALIGFVVAALLIFSLRRSLARRAARRRAAALADAWSEAGRRTNPPPPDETGPDDETVDLGPDSWTR